AGFGEAEGAEAGAGREGDSPVADTGYQYRARGDDGSGVFDAVGAGIGGDIVAGGLDGGNERRGDDSSGVDSGGLTRVDAGDDGSATFQRAETGGYGREYREVESGGDGSCRNG
ncbi:unnamed protein product, partial [Laminaria digitata]